MAGRTVANGGQSGWNEGKIETGWNCVFSLVFCTFPVEIRPFTGGGGYGCVRPDVGYPPVVGVWLEVV